MGFEIKNICTVVPNPYHPNYNKNNGRGDGYYYFSLFITPRLQFDGTLKEFYEMLNWPEYAEKIFWETGEKEILKHVKLSCTSSSKMEIPIALEKDDSYIKDLCKNKRLIDQLNEYDASILQTFKKKDKGIWKKLFHENVPVEALPINLKPQISAIVVSDNKEEKPPTTAQQPQHQAATAGNIQADRVNPQKMKLQKIKKV